LNKSIKTEDCFGGSKHAYSFLSMVELLKPANKAEPNVKLGGKYGREILRFKPGTEDTVLKSKVHAS
jgi:hypothetical protein